MQTITGNSLLSTELYVHADCGLESNTDFPVRIKLLSNKFCNENDTIETVINFRVAPILDLGPAMVPNAFSPNGDGINDVFKINLAARTICPDEFELKIYDRWGQILYETIDPEFTWSGDGQFPGAYVYYLRIGETKQTGFIALVK
jgi:gliding motility-associated-like protein